MTLVTSSFCLKKKKKEEKKKIDINHTQEGRSLQPPRRGFAMKTECKGRFDLKVKVLVTSWQWGAASKIIHGNYSCYRP
jgi:hypothetical protein